MLERIAVGAFAANCWILPADPLAGPDSKDCVVVDPGAEADRIISFLDERGLMPRLIACTHGHVDHICAIGPLKAAFAARSIDLRVAIHREDAGYLGEEGEARNRDLFRQLGAGSFFKSIWSPVPPADIFVEDGELLPGTGWRVIHTPGHSKGSICLYAEPAGLLVSGDTLFRDGVGRTDGPDASMEELRESIGWKLFSLPASTKVFPGHGDPTTIGRERGD